MMNPTAHRDPPDGRLRNHRALLALILAVYFALALGYGAVTPLFEAPDEHMHYFTADFIAREGRLPDTDDPGLMAQESAQPPLYYVLGSLIVRAVPNATDAAALWTNPRSNPADPLGESLATPPLNVNMFIHGPTETWPWRGYALAAHLLRVMSAVMGLGTLLCIYGAGRTVWPDAPDRALLAIALVAFLPQFAFLHGSVSNDAAITFFSAAAVWQLLRLTRPGARPSVAACLLLGLTAGLALLSKTAGLLLLVYCAGVLAAFVWSRGGSRRWTAAMAAGAAVALPGLLLGGWWLWRNWVLYGDPTAANQFVLLTGGERPYTLAQVWHDMDRVWTSLFARFGWMNVRPPRWVWAVWSAIAAAAAAGAGWATLSAARRAKRPAQAADFLFHPAVLLAGWFALVALGWLQFMLRTPADQGRLFFPTLIPLALGAAYGLSRWPRPWVSLAAAGLALFTSVYCLAAVIPSTYARSPVVAALPPQATPLDIEFPEGMELLGVDVETPVVRAGEWAWLTLYWRAQSNLVSGAPLVYLELFGRDFHRIGTQTGYHGRGNHPATLWPAGAIVADRVAVRVDEAAVVPVQAGVAVKLDEEAEGIPIAQLKVIPREWPAAAEPLATLGDGLQLTGTALSAESAAPGEIVELRLRWHIIAPPGPARLHLFVHAGPPDQEPLAQMDRPIMDGEYPPSLWDVGETFVETVPLLVPDDMPPGEHALRIGVYDFDSGARLPLVVDGTRAADDALEVGRLTIR